MRENRTSGSEGGEAQTNELSLPLSFSLKGEQSLVDLIWPTAFQARTNANQLTGKGTGKGKGRTLNRYCAQGSDIRSGGPAGRMLTGGDHQGQDVEPVFGQGN